MVPDTQQEAWEGSLGPLLEGQGWDVPGIDPEGVQIPCRPSETSSNGGQRTVRGRLRVCLP